MKQLDLMLTPRRARPRELPPLERLQAVVQRRGLDPHWRRRPYHRGWIMPVPSLGVGDRARTEPRDADSGLPVQGCWETLCGWCINHVGPPACPEEVYSYREREGAAA